MPIFIIDNKKVELTSDQLEMYQAICKSYDRPNSKGSDLFVGLFETDNRGIITQVIPPSNRWTSMEVIIFLMSIMQYQHIALMEKEVAGLCDEYRSKLSELNNKLKELDEKLK